MYLSLTGYDKPAIFYPELMKRDETHFRPDALFLIMAALVINATLQIWINAKRQSFEEGSGSTGKFITFKFYFLILIILFFSLISLNTFRSFGGSIRKVLLFFLSVIIPGYIVIKNEAIRNYSKKIFQDKFLPVINNLRSHTCTVNPMINVIV